MKYLLITVFLIIFFLNGAFIASQPLPLVEAIEQVNPQDIQYEAESFIFEVALFKRRKRLSILWRPGHDSSLVNKEIEEFKKKKLH